MLAWFSWSLLALSAACVLGLVGLPLLRHYGAYPLRKEISARQPGPVIGAILLAAAVLIAAAVTL